MGRVYEHIDGRLQEFLVRQPLFFVATAPLAADGHVNCSPKRNDGEFAVLDGSTVAYLDRTGSGAETIAHLKENGRIVFMFCAFDGPPMITRLHGHGRVTSDGDPEMSSLLRHFPKGPGNDLRSVIVAKVERIATSCGYGVPIMAFENHRREMERFAELKGPDGLIAYRAGKNAASIDSLPALGPLPG